MEHIHGFYTNLQRTEGQNIYQILDIIKHLAGFHKTVVNGILRRFGRVLHLPIFQKVQIIAQYPLTMQFLFLERLCQRVLRLPQRCRSRGLVRVNPKVIRQLLSRLVLTQVEQPCHKVDHVTSCPATEAVKVILIQLHTGRVVIVEGAAGHIAAPDLQTVVFGSLSHCDHRLDVFKKIHTNTSVIFLTIFSCHLNIRRKTG